MQPVPHYLTSSAGEFGAQLDFDNIDGIDIGGMPNHFSKRLRTDGSAEGEPLASQYRRTDVGRELVSSGADLAKWVEELQADRADLRNNIQVLRDNADIARNELDFLKQQGAPRVKKKFNKTPRKVTVRDQWPAYRSSFELIPNHRMLFMSS